MNLSIELHRATEKFPPGKARYLVDQSRRGSVSIPSNIAEGAGRQTAKEFIRFLHMAQGSLSELDTQLEISRQLGFLRQDVWAQYDGQLLQIDKMISGLIRQQKGIREESGVKGEDKERVFNFFLFTPDS